MSSKKFSTAYHDRAGTTAYWRDPKGGGTMATPATAKMAAQSLRRKQKERVSAPTAASIYEPWMEPGRNSTPAPPSEAPQKKISVASVQTAPPPTPPAQPSPKPPTAATRAKPKYRYFQDYSLNVRDDSPPRTPTKAVSPAPRNKTRGRYDAMDRKQDADDEDDAPPSPMHRARTPQPRYRPPSATGRMDRKADSPPPAPVTPPPRKAVVSEEPEEDEGDEEDGGEEFVKWVANGRDDDMKKSKDLLFKPKKRGRKITY